MYWQFDRNEQFYLSDHAYTIETQYNDFMRALGPRKLVCYIRYFVLSVVNKQYKTK